MLAVLLSSGGAMAVTNEPDGTPVPRDSKNGEVQLYTLFANRSDPVDFLQDSHTTPATFSPLCNFKATFVLHQAGSNRGVGWYNVDPKATTAPALAQIHVIVPAGTAVGTVVTSATIQGDPAYAGGLIGFALVDGQIHYSEQQWNVACTNFITCPTPAPWITSVTYQSKTTPNAYYLAFEDGSVDAFAFNNDGDFNDDVFFFEGLTCDGGGTPCDTGKPGACAAGLNECDGASLVCKSAFSAAPEKCNGVDDDCNGQTDDGDLCDAGFVCDHGSCVARCGGSEFRCSGGKVCNPDGYCVDPACAALSCPSGTACIGGACRAPCDGVTCPAPTVCRAGLCVDPCVGVECKTGSVCDRGVCAPGCACNPCAAGLACDAATQRCVEPACVGMVCPAHSRCVAGACADPCATAVCPAGQTCTLGSCVPGGTDAGAGAAGAGASGAGGGAIFVDTGGTTGTGTTTSGGAGAFALAGGAGGALGTGGADAGGGDAKLVSCGCRTAGGRGGAPHVELALGLASLAWARRRRSARKR
jgi:hypothetical protein